jgi:hypothetical protein
MHILLIKIVQDFHVYVTSYVDFFNPDDPDCDKTTFHYEWAQYDPPSDWPVYRIVLLKTDLRRELNHLVSRLNQVISAATDQANRETGRDRVHFVDVNTRFEKNHRWCEEGNFHEPAPDRQDTWLFLSAWPDVAIEGQASAEDSQDEADRQVLIKAGGIKLPDAATCNGKLGFDPDPHAHWICRAAEAIAREPDGALAQSLDKANTALTNGDIHAEHINWWLATRQIKTFHPRSPGMVAYRDAVIEAVDRSQTTESGTCKLDITQIWTCEDVAKNLYARMSITDPRGKVLYTTPGPTSAPGVPINDANRFTLKEDGMSNALTVVGEHQKDYIQFHYGDVAWTSGDTQGAATCKLVGDNWSNDGPVNCPTMAVVSLSPIILFLYRWEKLARNKANNYN